MAHHHAHGGDCGHDHGGTHSHGDAAPRALVRALVVTAVFMGVEAVGGFFANSLALLSDAGHMLTDVGALLLSLFALWIARRPRTANMSFGYHRAEILGALASGILIWLLTGLLVYEAVARLSHPEEVKGLVVFVVATLGLAANLLGMRFLHSEKKSNINVRAAYVHMLADSLGSVGAIIAGLVLWLTGWSPIDPLITIVFAALMLYSSWNLVAEAVAVLMESSPPGIDPKRVGADLRGLSGVREIHDLHIWSVSSGRLALSVHIITERTDGILGEANELLQNSYGIAHTTIQIEHPDRFASEHCYDCSPGA